jgi:hypothetical protein
VGSLAVALTAVKERWEVDLLVVVVVVVVVVGWNSTDN